MEAVACAPHSFAPNDQSWECGRGKRLNRLGKAPVVTAAGRAGAALGSLTLAGNFNEERNMAPIHY